MSLDTKKTVGEIFELETRGFQKTQMKYRQSIVQKPETAQQKRIKEFVHGGVRKRKTTSRRWAKEWKPSKRSSTFHMTRARASISPEPKNSPTATATLHTAAHTTTTTQPKMSNQPPAPPKATQSPSLSSGVSSPAGSTAMRNSNSPGPFARPPVRRLSQLEPVHIAALNQEYRSQIREAAKASNADAQREHYDKARKIKVLLEKHAAMVQEKRKKQQSASPQPQSPQQDALFKVEDAVTLNSTPSPSLPKSVSPQPSTPSISQQMAANTPRYQYSQTAQSSKPSGSDSQSQYSQFRVQLDASSPASAATSAGQSTTPTTSGPYYNKSMQFQGISSEPLTAQLQRYKQMEKEAQDQLTEVERSIRETPNLDAEQRAKLRSQEQQLRTKRDQFKSMALTITQQLQSSMVKQQKFQNQKQAQKAKAMEKLKASKYPSKLDGSSYNTTPTTQSYSEQDSQSHSHDTYQGSYASSTNASRQSSPTASPPPPDNYASGYSSYSKYGSSATLPSSTMGSKSLPLPMPTLPSSAASLASLASLGSPMNDVMSSTHNMTGSKSIPPGGYKHMSHNMVKSYTAPGKPIRVPGKVGRPPLTPNAMNAKRMPVLPSAAVPSVPVVIPEKVFNKRKINELIKSLMPEDMEGVIENEVEDLVGDLVEEFVGNITTFACRLAKHRRAEYVESKDVQVHLERNWNIRVPGFPGDEVSIVRKNVPTKSYNNKLDMVNANKAYGGVNRM